MISLPRLVPIALAVAFVCPGVSLAAPPGSSPAPRAEPAFTAEQIEFFEKQVEPILKNRCLKCHGAEAKIKGGLRLTSRKSVLAGGDQGPAVVLDKPAESLLIRAINYEELEMPPSGKLPAAEIETLTQWVKEGLPFAPGRDEPDEHPARPAPPGDGRDYWAYQPLKRPAVPAVAGESWVANPIDAFILARLEGAGLAPNGRASKSALARRLYYDLWGLPPTPEQVDAFVQDTAPDAYERLIDRLLDSPLYGQKWGRHWLDLVRFAETHGYERDSAKPFAWRYRDYVIESIQNDKPYDQFLLEQLAGDLLPEVTPETMIATGYYRLGIWDDEPADRQLARFDVLDGVVSTTGQVVLGMTLGCARCHDHKRDPLPQRDYYRMLAFFRDVTDMNVKNTRRVATAEEQSAHQRRLREKESAEAELFAQIHAIQQQFIKALAARGIRAGREGSDLANIRYRFYRDSWEHLPDFEVLKPEAEGTIANGLVSLSPASRGESMALVFEAALHVPQSAEYEFHLEATEGARLLIDGRVVLEAPKRGRHVLRGQMRLRAGLLPWRLEYFNNDATPHLQLQWSGPGFTRRSLSEESGQGRPLAADARNGPQEWAYTFDQPAGNWAEEGFDDGAWRKGAAGFGAPGTPGAVVRTEWRAPNIWLRRTFQLEQVPELLALDVHHDEDAEVYLNGQLVWTAGGYKTAYERLLLPAKAARALRRGANVLAVHCRQTAGGQYVDVGLSEATSADRLAELLMTQGKELLGEDVVLRHARLVRQLAQSRKETIPPPGIEVMCVEERGQEPTHVLIRGNPSAPGERVEPGFPEVLCSNAPVAQDTALANDVPKRLRLARWLTSPANPLTARVLANRLWQYHFGRGIVPTPNDFGKLGEPPTHPELLDWLAAQLIEQGWRIKPLHRLILNSNAWRMASTGRPDALAKDPANSLYWRFNMRRLAAEEIRDSFLAVSGQLNPKAGGPGVFPPIPQEVLAGQSRPGDGWGRSPPEEANRRSVYVHVKRSLLVPILEQHDAADTDSSCPVRYTTTVPTQALGMLNGEFTNQQAGAMAARLQREFPGAPREQARRAIRLITGREPLAAEIDRDLAFMQGLAADQRVNPAEALRLYCLLLLNSNEFVYVD